MYTWAKRGWARNAAVSVAVGSDLRLTKRLAIAIEGFLLVNGVESDEDGSAARRIVGVHLIPLFRF